MAITHVSELDVVEANGGTKGLYLDGVLITKTATEINEGLSLAAPEANIATISNSATGTQIATAVNAIIAALIAAGIVAAP